MKKKLSPILLLLIILAAALLGIPLSNTGPEVIEVPEIYIENVIPAEETEPVSAGRQEISGQTDPAEALPTEASVQEEPAIDHDGVYTSKDDVALYIHTYGYLPGNFMTKKEARSLGWEGGGMESYAPGMCIGGDRFGNYEGLLPEDRDYTECDIDTLGKSSRGAKRIVFSDDGLIYYTDDHYESFVLLYGEP